MTLIQETEEMKKWCRQCGRHLPRNWFRTSWNKECLECIHGPDKYCAKCGEVKAKSEFNSSADRWTDGLFPWCRQCYKRHR